MRLLQSALPALAALSLSSLAGCSTWRVAQVSPAQAIAAHPDRVLLEMRDGSVHQLAAPKVEGDSLTGVVAGSAPAGAPLVREAYALTDVARIAAPDRDAARTVGAVVGPPALVLVGLLLVGD
jgi:hypothetical protein